MYMYIVRRTQIYLTESEAEALGRESKRTGRTRSQLIREAIGARYLHAQGTGDLEATLRETAGAWKDAPGRPTGKDYVEGIRRGGRLSAALLRRKRS